MEEIKYIIATYNINFLWFSSETFLMQNEKEFEKFAQRYIDEFNIPFWCQTRLDTFTDRNISFYKRLGYEIDECFHEPTTNPTYWLMIKNQI